MSKDTVTRISPIFAIPDGAEDQFVQTGEFIDGEAVEVEDLGGDGPALVEETIATPQFNIVAQTLRRGPGGQQVVDIVVETEDIGGAINYEFRITKL